MPKTYPIRTINIIKDHNPIQATHQVLGEITTQEEAMVPLDHHIQVLVVPLTVLHLEALVGAEAALEVGNIEEKFNDNEKVHP